MDSNCRTLCVRSNGSTNCATTTTTWFAFLMKIMDLLKILYQVFYSSLFQIKAIVFLNWPSSASFRLFSSFQTNNTLFTTNQCKKCPFSIHHPDSNPRPLKHELTLITTRPGLPTLSKQLLKQLFPDKKISQHICFLYFLLLLLLFG